MGYQDRDMMYLHVKISLALDVMAKEEQGIILISGFSNFCHSKRWSFTNISPGGGLSPKTTVNFLTAGQFIDGCFQ